MNIVRSLRFFYDRKIAPGFRVKENDLVVDIGSGEKPFWRADVFVDKLSLGNVQRASKFDTIHNLGIFVDSDVQKMPFKDGIFDFSFSSHLLEHVINPEAAIKEITRISKAGYLEVPNGILETIKPFNSHLWFIYNNNNKLIFVRKSKQLHSIMTINGKNLDYLLGRVEQPFIQLYWKKTIQYEIIDNLKQSEKFISKMGNSHNSSGFNFYLLLARIWRIIFYKKKPNARIKSIFKNSKAYDKKSN